MSRPLRHVQPGGSRFEITTRAFQSRYLIPTGEHFRSIAIGILAKAKELHPVELYAFGGLSNHLHILIGAADVDQLSGFMRFVNGNLAREANKIVGWKEKFWGRRYRAIEISDEEEALVGRLRYVMSHGPKENLVLRCRQWPGLQCIDALTEGKPLEGIWFDRTLQKDRPFCVCIWVELATSAALETEMGRPARFIPKTKNGVLVEVTCRVIGARVMLVPPPNPRTFNEIIVGVIGRALEVSPLELCSAVWLGNHTLCAAAHKIWLLIGGSWPALRRACTRN